MTTMSSKKSMFIVVGVLLLSMCFMEMGGACFLKSKARIHIINDVGRPGVNLSFRCKSKDSDLGSHVLGYRGSFSFHFCPNMFGTTLFFCSFAWGGQSHWFDIYEAKRDQNCGDCTWNITPTGPCLVTSTAPLKRQLCYPWK
ncbi:hypothetical protein Tsubulata_047624 [Turnera subulata]|uniref:S-protein homolog n=1 Tax=Turnera subulata TaxID=218843 RepID=A0A9Q0FV21_9ROSI|nr:hypothetical protein Tsubulata_047624 [Turnera subulata]